ncbi:Type IV secretory pathway, VirD4 components [Mycobacteroides abscessus subsp. abscessus]|nr:Type IV secretory pathway, VirD4 components [Mycobacteroides abscessus subsp. abscessus]
MRRNRKSVFIGRGDQGEPIFASTEDSVIVLGKARSEKGVTGKSSGIFTPSVACHPGLVIATSVRSGHGEYPDVRDTTIGARHALASETGGKVIEWVVDDLYPTVAPLVGVRGWWDLVSGCATWNTALSRAASLSFAGIKKETTNPSYFRNSCINILAPLLCYADCAGLSDGDVVWIIRNATWESEEVVNQRADESPVGMMNVIAENLASWFGDGHPAVTGVTRFFDDRWTRAEDRAVVLSVLASEVLALFSFDIAPDLVPFDFPELFSGYSTIYISASESRSEMVAPLVAAFCSSLVELWRSTPQSKRPPSLLLALDEVTIVAPFEGIPALVSSGGGDGIQCLLGFQDLGQVRAKWGERATEIVNGATYEVLFPGLRDTQHLKDISELLVRDVQYDDQISVISDLQTGSRYADAHRLRSERQILEAQLKGVSPTSRRIVELRVGAEFLTSRMAAGLITRPGVEGIGATAVINEIRRNTRVDSKAERRSTQEPSDLAAGRAGSVFVISGMRGRYIKSNGWWRDELWSTLLRPIRPAV